MGRVSRRRSAFAAERSARNAQAAREGRRDFVGYFALLSLLTLLLAIGAFRLTQDSPINERSVLLFLFVV